MTGVIRAPRSIQALWPRACESHVFTCWMEKNVLRSCGHLRLYEKHIWLYSVKLRESLSLNSNIFSRWRSKSTFFLCVILSKSKPDCSSGWMTWSWTRLEHMIVWMCFFLQAGCSTMSSAQSGDLSGYHLSGEWTALHATRNIQHGPSMISAWIPCG